MPRPTTSARIFGAAYEVVASHGLEFGQGAGQDLEAFADAAAADIAALPQDKQELRTEEAQAAFRLIAIRMLEARADIPGYIARNPGIVGEETLSAARDGWHIWPFG
jgi:hypothetical protein